MENCDVGLRTLPLVWCFNRVLVMGVPKMEASQNRGQMQTGWLFLQRAFGGGHLFYAAFL